MLCKKAHGAFDRFAEMRIMPVGQLYGGKICAALDRQLIYAAASYSPLWPSLNAVNAMVGRPSAAQQLSGYPLQLLSPSGSQ